MQRIPEFVLVWLSLAVTIAAIAAGYGLSLKKWAVYAFLTGPFALIGLWIVMRRQKRAGPGTSSTGA